MSEQFLAIAPTTPPRWARRFAEVEREDDVAVLLRDLTTEYGLAGYLLINLPPSASTEIAPFVLMTNWPAEMLEGYDREGLVHGSPCPRFLRRDGNGDCRQRGPQAGAGNGRCNLGNRRLQARV